MTHVNTILCAIDFSRPSRSALELAADLARRYDAPLTVVHVVEPPPATAGDMLGTVPELEDAARREVEDPLQRSAEDAHRLSGKTVHTALLTGRPAEEIVRYAEQHRFDLVVVGTHGRKGLRRMVLGSVAERVARLAPCPVVVARDVPDVDED